MEFILSPDEENEKNEDERPLWKIKKLKDSKGKRKLLALVYKLQHPIILGSLKWNC